MGSPNVLSTIATFALLVTLSTAIPQSPSRTLQQLSPRQDAADSAQSSGLSCPLNQKCPGIYPSAGSCNGTNIEESINDAGLLVHAARMALRLSLVRSIVFLFNLITKPTTHSFLFRGASLTHSLAYSPRSLHEKPQARLSDRASHGIPLSSQTLLLLVRKRLQGRGICRKRIQSPSRMCRRTRLSLQCCLLRNRRQAGHLPRRLQYPTRPLRLRQSPQPVFRSPISNQWPSLSKRRRSRLLMPRR